MVIAPSAMVCSLRWCGRIIGTAEAGDYEWTGLDWRRDFCNLLISGWSVELNRISRLSRKARVGRRQIRAKTYIGFLRSIILTLLIRLLERPPPRPSVLI